MKVTEEQILEQVKEALRETDCVLCARIYGSWLYNEQSVDMDIAVVVQSEFGVVDPHHYRTLHELRVSLCAETMQDVDLVPHTEDEFANRNSPLWYPRYNPSLVFGQDLKGSFRISSISKSTHLYSFADLTAHVFHDNRTVCRRQLIRSFSKEEARIFVSKLLHGPGNALTYQACKHRMDYIKSPSNLEECFKTFDRVFDVDSSPAIDFLRICKKSIELERGILLMNWYENLLNLVLHGDQFKVSYQRICALLGQTLTR